MSGKWTLIADFADHDGDQRSFQLRVYSTSQIVDSAAHTIFDDCDWQVVDGEGTVDLPAGNTFGFNITRTRGQTRKWLVPGQIAGTTHYLSDFTSTSDVPMPLSALEQISLFESELGTISESVNTALGQIGEATQYEDAPDFQIYLQNGLT